MAAETLGQIARRQALARPAAPAFSYQDRVTSFAAADAGSDAIGRRLAADVPSGARIGYLGKNSDRFFELLFGAAKAGLVMTPIGWRLTAPEIEFLIQDAGIALLFAEPAFAAVAQALQAAVPELRVVALDAPAHAAWRAGRSAGLPLTSPEDAVLQLYTSGTTGRPKGAVFSHASLLSLRAPAAAAGQAWDQWHHHDVSLLTMPVAHVSGALWGLLGFYHGAKTVILPEFRPAEVIGQLSAENITRVFLVPTAISAMLRDPAVATADFSRLRYMLYGAAPIPLDLLREAMRVFGCGFVQCYGMTETCGMIAALPPEDHDPAGNQRMRSAGRAVPGVRIRIADADLRTVPPGVTGEILIRAPTLMMGYWGQPEATAQALSDGEIRTGDAGFLDDDGYVFVQDRIKDLIITGGENVYPAEVESVLYGHPDIADAAVIGLADPHWGEVVTAVVVLRDGVTASEADIQAWARRYLASYKTPKRIVFRETLPRNATGKLLRRELRAALGRFDTSVRA